LQKNQQGTLSQVIAICIGHRLLWQGSDKGVDPHQHCLSIIAQDYDYPPNFLECCPSFTSNSSISFEARGVIFCIKFPHINVKEATNHILKFDLRYGYFSMLSYPGKQACSGATLGIFTSSL